MFVAHYAPSVPAAARGAVDAAMEIWSQRLVSSVPIEVDVAWGGGLPRNVAASTEPVAYAPAVDGVLAPIALANAGSGRDLRPGTSDIKLLLGSGIRWYTGTDGAAPANATDMVTMVLHELAHGLGFAHSFRLADGGLASGGDGAPMAFDSHVFDPSTGPLVDAASVSDRLSAATSRRIVWRGNARDGRGGAPVMYAPRAYEPGSSLSHFDDDAYPEGDPDALMTSLIRRGEVVHRVGPAALGVLRDLGWDVRAEPATTAALTSTTESSTSTTAFPATTTVPVLVRHVAKLGDFGRADVVDATGALPVMLATALSSRWLMARWRVRRRVMRDGSAALQQLTR